MPQTPPFGGKPPQGGKPLPRPPTHPGSGKDDRRDLESWAARQERERHDNGVPDTQFEDITGNYEAGEPRQTARKEKRTIEARVDHIEGKLDKFGEKHDALAEVVTETRVEVGKMSGKLDILPQLVTAVQGMAQSQQQREHMTFTAKLDVDKAREEAKIEVEKTAEVLKLKDEAAKKRERRKRITLIATAVTGLLGSGYFIHWLVSKL